jgi:hypothetical protein
MALSAMVETKAEVAPGALPFVISSTAASTFYLDGKQTGFFLNAANGLGNICFPFDSPAQHVWVALGVGDQMEGALMLFVCPSKGNKRKHFHAGKF